MRASILVLVVFLFSPTSAAGEASWSVVVDDPTFDNAHVLVQAIAPGTPSCPATDITRASMSFDGASYVWEFTVVNALASCGGAGVPFETVFPLYKKHGAIVGRATLDPLAGGSTFEYSTGRGGGYQHWSTTFFEGDTARFEIPADFGIAREDAFAMSAFVDVSSIVVPCCVYQFRDDLRAP